jgi:hypothetical protein
LDGVLADCPELNRSALAAQYGGAPDDTQR